MSDEGTDVMAGITVSAQLNAREQSQLGVLHTAAITATAPKSKARLSAFSGWIIFAVLFVFVVMLLQSDSTRLAPGGPPRIESHWPAWMALAMTVHIASWFAMTKLVRANARRAELNTQHVVDAEGIARVRAHGRTIYRWICFARFAESADLFYVQGPIRNMALPKRELSEEQVRMLRDHLSARLAMPPTEHRGFEVVIPEAR